MRSGGSGGSSSCSTSAKLPGGSDRAISARCKPHFFGPGKLMDAEGGGDVGQVVLIARRDDAIVPSVVAGEPLPGVVRQSVQRHLPHPIGQRGVVGDGHAALAGRDGLVGVEGEAGDGGGVFAAAAPADCGFVDLWIGGLGVGCREAVGGVFDDPQAVLGGKRLDRVHVHHQSADMHGHDPDDAKRRIQRRLAGSQLFDLSPGVAKVHVQGDRIAIDQQRNGTLVAHRPRPWRRRSSWAPARPGQGPGPSASTARCSAAVQELTATACLAPVCWAKVSPIACSAGRWSASRSGDTPRLRRFPLRRSTGENKAPQCVVDVGSWDPMQYGLGSSVLGVRWIAGFRPGEMQQTEHSPADDGKVERE